MASGRRIMSSPFWGPILSWLAARYIRLVWLTGRWRVENEEIARNLVEKRTPFIACFWHGRMLMIPNAWSYAPRMQILISQHRDGAFISRALGYLGIGTIAGSTTRGGTVALRGIIRALNSGEYVGITPDGPRGPREKVSSGTIAAARLSGAVLLPVTYGAKRRKVLDSWDRFVIPFPFTRGIIEVGQPLPVLDSSDESLIEAARKELEDALVAITTSVDRKLGASETDAG